MTARTLAKGANVALADVLPAGVATVGVALGWDDQSAAALEVDGVVVLARGGTGPAPGTGAASRLLLAQQAPNPSEGPSTGPPPRPLTGDAERLVVTLDAVPAEVGRVLFGLALYDAAGRRPTFRLVRGAYVRLLAPDGTEVVRAPLGEGAGPETAIVLGELYRHQRGWKFRAVGQGYVDGLAGLAADVGAGTGAGPGPGPGPGAGQGSGSAGGAGAVATARPADVAGFLTRTSVARSRRNVAAHLRPPRATAPSPPAPASPPRPVSPPPRPTRPPAPTRPAPPPPAPSRPAPARPAPPRPAPPRPAAPAPEPEPRRSSLDLGGSPEPRPGPAPAAPTVRSGGLDLSTPSHPAAPRPAPAPVREHSSRYRQRMEHVSVLDDDHPATIWTAEQRGTGAMTVTLRWTPLTTRTGLPRPSDIHLGCLWQAADGQAGTGAPGTSTAGLLQTLGNAVSAPGRGARHQVLRLGRRDERDGQTLFADLATLPTFKRFFVFAYGLRGVPEWESLRALVTVDAAEHLTMRLGEAPPHARVCVVGSFHIVEDELVIRRENDFVEGTQADAAARYGWALDWTPDGTALREGR